MGMLIFFLSFLGDPTAIDARIFPVCRAVHPPENTEVYTVYVVLNGAKARGFDAMPHGVKTRNRISVTDGLYLQIYTLGHSEVKNGMFGYYFALSNDSEGKKELRTSNQPSHGFTENQLAAFHFRNTDNSAANGIKNNLNAAGEHRYITYEQQWIMEIRVLEFEIVDAAPAKTPGFRTLRCLVTLSRPR